MLRCELLFRITAKAEAFRRGTHVVHAMHMYLLFTATYRSGVLDDDMPAFCEQVTRKVCRDLDAELVECTGNATTCICW